MREPRLYGPASRAANPCAVDDREKLAQVGHMQTRPGADVGPAAIHPAEGHAGRHRRPSVRAHVVAHVEGFPGPDPKRVERHREDAWIGLREPAALGRHHHSEERLEPRHAEPRPLHAVDAVRDHPEEQASSVELAEDRTAARQPVAASAESLEVGRAHRGGLSQRCPQEREQAAKALFRQGGLADPALPVELPERLVDASVLGENRPGARKAQVLEALAQSASLSTVEIQEGAVEVEKDGAGAQGGLISLGR